MKTDQKSIVIGICGGTGSGKTTLAKRLYDALDGNALLIGMDCYYKHCPEIPFEKRVKANYDHPDAFDVDLMLSQLKELKAGKSVTHPTYDFSTYLRKDEWKKVQPKPVIIIEGILLFAVPEIVDELDIKIYVDTDADVRILRRIMRDVNERGRSLESVVSQYLETAKPMHEYFIEPSKRCADIIVPEGGRNEVAFDMIAGAIRRKIKN
ncbi:MAG: uridine kinase [Clostridia bacterium]|nr:uridine kinase [Clostridia bacterium]